MIYTKIMLPCCENQVVYAEIDSDDSDEEEDEFENADEESGKLFYQGHLIIFSFHNALLVWTITSLISIYLYFSLVASIIAFPTQISRIDEKSNLCGRASAARSPYYESTVESCQVKLTNDCSLLVPSMYQADMCIA